MRLKTVAKTKIKHTLLIFEFNGCAKQNVHAEYYLQNKIDFWRAGKDNIGCRIRLHQIMYFFSFIQVLPVIITSVPL